MADFTWRIISERPRRGYAESFRYATRDMWMKVGKYHTQTILPRHFKEEAYQRYGAQTRSTKYDIRKRNKWHHTKPLVWSGTLRSKILHGYSIAATFTKLVITLSGPSWLKGYTMLRRSGKAPDKEKEITIVLEEEMQAYAKWAEKDQAKAMSSRARKRTVSA